MCKPDCDGKFLIERFASGSRFYDFDNERDKAQLRELFRKESHTAIVRHLSTMDQFASAKCSRHKDKTRSKGGIPEVDKLRHALDELKDARMQEATKLERLRAPKYDLGLLVHAKEENVRLRLRRFGLCFVQNDTIQFDIYSFRLRVAGFVSHLMMRAL